MKFEEIKGYQRKIIILLQNILSLPQFLHIVKNFTCSTFEKYHLTKQLNLIYLL